MKKVITLRPKYHVCSAHCLDKIGNYIHVVLLSLMQ